MRLEIRHRAPDALSRKEPVRLHSFRFRTIICPGWTRFGLLFSDASLLGPVQFASLLRSVPAGSGINRFASVRFLITSRLSFESELAFEQNLLQTSSLKSEVRSLRSRSKCRAANFSTKTHYTKILQGLSFWCVPVFWGISAFENDILTRGWAKKQQILVEIGCICLHVSPQSAFRLRLHWLKPLESEIGGNVQRQLPVSPHQFKPQIQSEGLKSKSHCHSWLQNVLQESKVPRAKAHFSRLNFQNRFFPALSTFPTGIGERLIWVSLGASHPVSSRSRQMSAQKSRSETCWTCTRRGWTVL